MFYSAPAAAQATRTWISGVGDDVNPCSRTAPCKTFQGAISKTASGGEINCLDPGGFGGVTITKSISIVCDNNPVSGVLVASTNGIIVNGAGVIVLISGLDIEGLGQTGSPGINGIAVVNAASVTVRKTKIRGFRNGYGISFTPISNANLVIDEVQISESGMTGNVSTGGVLVQPNGLFTVQATITNSRVTNNASWGIRLDTTVTPGSVVNATITGVTTNGNGQGGIFAKAGSGTVSATVNDSTSSFNTMWGLVANATGATMRVNNSVITNNATGIALVNSATISSYGNNVLDANGTNGAFSSTIPLH
jgi:hypothetical protein